MILTSNLGARSFERAAAGFSGGHPAGERAAEHFTAEVRSFLRPELFNRIDRIIPFLPLEREVARTITRREVDKLAARPGLVERGMCAEDRRGVRVTLTDKGRDLHGEVLPLQRAVLTRMLSD